MAHTYSSCLFHVVFSTKGRAPAISPELQPRLWPYIGGIARKHNMKALAVGGVVDHVHVLLSIPPSLFLSKGVQLIKGASSKWVHDEFPQYGSFAWQEGYGAFSIGISQVEDTIAYINNQESHHRRKSFQEEYLGFLKKHGIEYDEAYVWG